MRIILAVHNGLEEHPSLLEIAMAIEQQSGLRVVLQGFDSLDLKPRDYVYALTLTRGSHYYHVIEECRSTGARFKGKPPEKMIAGMIHGIALREGATKILLGYHRSHNYAEEQARCVEEIASALRSMGYEVKALSHEDPWEDLNGWLVVPLTLVKGRTWSIIAEKASEAGARVYGKGLVEDPGNTCSGFRVICWVLSTL